MIIATIREKKPMITILELVVWTDSNPGKNDISGIQHRVIICICRIEVDKFLGFNNLIRPDLWFSQ